MHRYEKLVLKAIASGASDIPALIKFARLQEDSIMRALRWLEEKGAVRIDREISRTYLLSPEGKMFLKAGFPEQTLMEKLSRGRSDLSQSEKRIGIPWALRNKWMRFTEKKEMEPTEKGIEEYKHYQMHSLIKRIGDNSLFPLKRGDDQSLDALFKRGSVLVKQKSVYSASITAKGRKLAEGIGEIKDEINVLDREHITCGRWKESKLARYNTLSPVERVFPGKQHPMKLLSDRIRSIFSDLGFGEMSGEPIETAFWNFDALFQPQDHPARELADTFYIKGKEKLCDENLVKAVRKEHERGWKYRWDRKVAEALVLRTHTTAVSAKYVQKSKGAPSKHFCIGRVYRNEQTDFKHLAEFYQVEGIVIWEKATFQDLLGLLKEFYKKLGFEKIRFRPSFFPYTEPSLEVEVYFEDRGEWLELGGAGIFRPEVCLPLCGKFPILAWGLSLERPLMLRLGVEDIRTFYRNDIGWLRDCKRDF
ncbi:MAG: phenylalanine--tRNA ligase subunit alpha [Candidatus Micrarchaeota archaeon]